MRTRQLSFSKARHKLTGFSLIELLLVLPIIVTLLMLGIVQLAQLINRYQLASDQQSVLDSAYFSRQLSLSSPGNWVLCMSRSATTEQLNCTSQAGKGNTWIVFDDKNDDGKRQADEKISQQWQLRYTDQQLFASGRSGLRFSNSQRSIDSGSILLCHPKLIHGVRVILFQSGSIRLSEDANNNGREDRNGTSLLCGVD